MSNGYFTPTGTPITDSEILSANLRSEYSAVGEGFDLLPALPGTALELLRRNAAGTALEAQAGSGAETTFTPTLIGIGAPAYVTQGGRISKVGPYAFVSIVISWTGGTDATAFTIGTLPYSAINSSLPLEVQVNQGSGALTWTGQLIARLTAVPSTTIEVFQMQSGVAYTTTPLLNRNAGTKDIRISGFYIIA